MKKILILNRKYTDNLGDISIGEALIHLFLQRECEVYQLEYSIFGKNIESFGLVSNAGSESKINFKKIKRSIAESLPRNVAWLLHSGRYLPGQIRGIPRNDIDLVVIGGGQLIQSYPEHNEFAYSFKFWNWINRHILKTKLAVIGVGAKENFSPYAERTFRSGLSNADFIYVRDHHSKEIIKRLDPNIKTKFIPDVAFSCRPDIPSSQAEKNTALVGIYDYNTYYKIHSLEPDKSSYYKQWKQKIDNLSAAGFKVKLFYSTGPDKIETKQFSKYLRDKYEVAEVNSLNELFILLSTAGYVYSGRMHALILAILSGCQVEAFITNTKLKVFDESYIQQKPDLKLINQEINAAIDDILSAI